MDYQFHNANNSSGLLLKYLETEYEFCYPAKKEEY